MHDVDLGLKTTDKDRERHSPNGLGSSLLTSHLSLLTSFAVVLFPC